MKLRFKELTADTWDDFVALFTSKGGPKYCWCMAYRADARERKLSSLGRKRAMKKRVDEGVRVGILGYLDGEPVAWCSIAPRDTFQNIVRVDEEERGVWSVSCMFLKRELRGEKLAEQLLAAAVKQAKKRGARIVEGYPVDADSPSYRHMGFVPLFERAGFREQRREGKRRHVMRRR